MPYNDFLARFKLLLDKRRDLIINTLSNIFTMRLVGNKTHGDLAEIGITEFVNQFMYDFSAKHTGKDLFRAKEHEEDIVIINELTKIQKNTTQILRIDEGHKYDSTSKSIVEGKGRKHPIYIFIDKDGNYICEVRYGGAAANALQRGFWAHTIHANTYFKSLTGWLSYEHNVALVKLFCLALNSTKKGHEQANLILQNDIDDLKRGKNV